MDFEGKVALVTGGAQGIGKAYVSELLDLGVKVSIADLNEAIGKQTEQELAAKYENKVIFIRTDVSDEQSFENAIQKTLSVFGKLDILINNAAYLNENNWKKMIEVNLVGVITGIKLAFEYMGKDKGKNGGQVINTASVAGIEPFHALPVYSSTKYGVVGATKNFGSEFYYKKHGVTVNAVCPGPVDTILFKDFMDTCLDLESAKEAVKNISALSPSVVAKEMIQLLKDAKNGALLRVDVKSPPVRYVE